MPAPAGHTSKKRSGNEPGREARARLQQDGAWTLQRPRARERGEAVKSRRAGRKGHRTARKGLVVRGLGHSGWQIRDLAGRSLEERIKGSEAGV